MGKANEVEPRTTHDSGSCREPATEMKSKSILGHFRFDRVELAGSFGDLGTLLPSWWV
jgi:hypothetical protein